MLHNQFLPLTMALVAYFPSSQSIAQIAWPSNRISTCLCVKCDYSIHLDAPSLDFHTILTLSRSDYNPDPSDCQTYLRMLEETRSEIERRETELRRLQEVALRLEEQKLLLQAYEAGIKDITSPIRKLPLDILGLILQYVCCGQDATDIANMYNSNSYHKLKKRLPTFDVRSVCSRWYDAVPKMPILWTSFGSNGYNVGKSQSFIRTFLERSGSNLIDFAIEDTTQNIRFYPSNLVDHCDRWRHVSIASPTTFGFVSGAFLQPLVRIQARLAASNLISLSLTCHPSPSYTFTITFPRLESLSLRGFVLDFQTPQATVTALELSQVTCQDALSFLRKVPNIRSLTMESITVGVPTVEDHSIVLDKLQTLILKYPLRSAKFLTAFQFPCLTHLYLDNSSKNIFEFQSEMLSLLDNCALTSLSIKDMSLSYDDLLRLFRRVPSLKHLDGIEWLTTSHRSNTMRWILELLAAPRHPGSQGLAEVSSQSTLDVEENVNSVVSDTDSDDIHEEEQEEHRGAWYNNAVYQRFPDYDEEDGDSLHDRRRPDADSYQANYHEDHHDDNLQELLLPVLDGLNLALRPRNELLLDVVRSRRPIPENTRSDPREGLTDRAWLQTLRVRYPQPHTRNRQVLEDFEALEERLKPFKEGGLDVVIEIPVLESDS
ncbi:hypothetical protein FB446DRAFT_265241 [Lentinula raphanica]|nr:hypothetical protein FB446DRAFT_265241 [Lentinula raphanica]